MARTVFLHAGGILAGKNRLGADHAALIASARTAIDTTDKLDDADTAGLFTDVSRGMDKLLWLIEAHVQTRD